MVSALWTLPIELGFYVAVLILMIAGRVNRGNLLAGLLILWSGLYLIPFALTEYGIGHLNVKPLGYGSLNVSLLRHGCFFGVGMMIWQVLNKRPRSIDLAILVGGIIICWVEIIARSAELSSHYSNPISLWLLVSGTLATFTSASFLIWWLGKVNNQVKIHRTAKIVLRRLGLMTYPLYLMHESVGGVTYGLLMGSGHGQGLSLIAGLLISLVASLLVVEVIEPSLRRCLLKVVHPLLIWLTTNNVIASLIGTFKPKIKPTKSPEYTIGGV